MRSGDSTDSADLYRGHVSAGVLCAAPGPAEPPPAPSRAASSGCTAPSPAARHSSTEGGGKQQMTPSRYPVGDPTQSSTLMGRPGHRAPGEVLGGVGGQQHPHGDTPRSEGPLPTVQPPTPPPPRCLPAPGLPLPPAPLGRPRQPRCHQHSASPAAQRLLHSTYRCGIQELI